MAVRFEQYQGETCLMTVCKPCMNYQTCAHIRCTNARRAGKVIRVRPENRWSLLIFFKRNMHFVTGLPYIFMQSISELLQINVSWRVLYAIDSEKMLSNPSFQSKTNSVRFSLVFLCFCHPFNSLALFLSVTICSIMYIGLLYIGRLQQCSKHLNSGSDRFQQTVQTKVRLLKEQSNEGNAHCLFIVYLIKPSLGQLQKLY